MSKEVTLLSNDQAFVKLGILEETGRLYYHVRFVTDGGQGGTSLADKTTEVPIAEVELREGFDYNALIDFQDRSRAMLQWRGRHQQAQKESLERAMVGVDAKVKKDMKTWEKENPEPKTFEAKVEQEPLSDDEIEDDLAQEEAMNAGDPNDDYPGEASDPGQCPSRYEGFQCQLADPNHADEHEVTVGGALWHWTDETAEKLEEPQGTGRVATVETPF